MNVGVDEKYTKKLVGKRWSVTRRTHVVGGVKVRLTGEGERDHRRSSSKTKKKLRHTGTLSLPTGHY